jgi:hypothetical protein
MSAEGIAHGNLSHNATPLARNDQPPHLASLQEAIEQAAHLLPSQGPITVFIHHNTLHAFEELPFDEAVQKGARLFGCHPYLTEDRYRAELVRGRIRLADLREVLSEDLKQAADEKVSNLCTRLELRLAMLQYPLRRGPVEELLWHVAETDALRRVRCEVGSSGREQLIAETRHWFLRDLRERGNGCSHAPRGSESMGRYATGMHSILKGIFERLSERTIEDWSDDEWEEFALRALWGICCQGVAGLPPFSPVPPVPIRHRDLLLAATGEDSDLPVHDSQIRFCAAFLDQGLAPWPLPYRDEGFFRAFSALYRKSGSPYRWRHALSQELGRLEDAHVSPLESIHESLEMLGVPEAEWHDYLAATLLALRGWAGLIQQMELRGDRVVRPVPKGSLLEYLAIRLVLERLALAETARNALAFAGPLSGLREEVRKHLDSPRPPSVEQRAFLVFQLAQILGWAPKMLYRLTKQEWQRLLEEIETFSSLERRRIFHRAYERSFYTRSLDALALHCLKPAATSANPRFQALFCIDEREESIRRHLEELAPPSGNLLPRRILLCPDVLSRRARRPLRPVVPGGDTAAALGRRASRRSPRRNTPAPRSDAARLGDGIASLAPRHSDVCCGSAIGNRRWRSGLGPSHRPYLFAALDLADAAQTEPLPPDAAADALAAGAPRARVRTRERPSGFYP